MEPGKERKVGFVILAQPGEEIGLKIKDRGETDHEYDQAPTAKETAKEAEGVSKSDGAGDDSHRCLWH